jgi:hypothetical protein
MSKKIKKSKVRDAHWYGMKKIKVGQKICWMAKEDKNGWGLGLALGNRTLWLRNLRFANRKEVERAMEKTAMVFIHLKESK